LPEQVGELAFPSITGHDDFVGSSLAKGLLGIDLKHLILPPHFAVEIDNENNQIKANTPTVNNPGSINLVALVASRFLLRFFLSIKNFFSRVCIVFSRSLS
jgi:hypothetical protein